MENRRENLTELLIPADTSDKSQDDHRQADTAHVTVMFRNHEKELMTILEEERKKGSACFGAIAWMTNHDILRKMAELPTAILVQKEDFLRPDTGKLSPDWKKQIRDAYQALTPPADSRYGMPGIVPNLSYCCNPTMDPVRCVGDRPEVGRNNRRMHNKFLVFAKRESFNDGEGTDMFEHDAVWRPHSVWTGSYNITANAELSWENVIYIRSEEIAQAYLNEWCQLMAFSEPLDWESEYVEPEWRVGT